ncbi:46 kDa FK506-binding nuclear protein-like [Contarinia nasturtii]|uniref:46 kDa FK506-binding nuclear protein-like n=1 Tax=Contarinia nasturtii TaxID=265458 RepID=UPI0012D3E35E|nr:46 kDa FK506-binding nuclear protein-like [Contarinia nasturtii]
MEQNLDTGTEFTLWARFENTDIPLANLNFTNSQVRLDLAFGSADNVTFFVDGLCTIFFTGYYLEIVCSECAEIAPKKRKFVDASTSNPCNISSTPKNVTPKSSRPVNTQLRQAESVSTMNTMVPNSSHHNTFNTVNISDNNDSTSNHGHIEDIDEFIEDDINKSPEQGVNMQVPLRTPRKQTSSTSSLHNMNTQPMNVALKTSHLARKPFQAQSVTNAPMRKTFQPNKVRVASMTDNNELIQNPKSIREEVTFHDISIGNGATVQRSSTVTISLVGSLESTGLQVFVNPNFKFKIGSSIAPSGLSEGIRGMTVGSTRRIRCPPSFAYGADGLDPSVPPFSNIIFEVSLLKIGK